MKFVLVIALVIIVETATAARKASHKPPGNADWKEFKVFHGKRYKDSAEEQMRRQIWEERKARIGKHNAEAASGKHSYTMALNHLSDMSEEELKSLTKAVPPKRRPVMSVSFATLKGSNSTIVTLPSSIDYRQNACLPAVKDQKLCGACWAFAANTPLEYAYCSKTGKAVVLSEQQLVDCSGPSEYNEGCEGGWYIGAWEYIMKAPGQAQQSDYPYISQNGICSYRPGVSSVQVSGYSWIPSRNETAIRNILAAKGPVSAAIHTVPSIYSYGSGIYSETSCSSDGYTADHAVVIVGYGVQQNIPYWIVRNSWSASWGQAGYFLMKRGINQCNIEAWPAYPVL